MGVEKEGVMAAMEREEAMAQEEEVVGTGTAAGAKGWVVAVRDKVPSEDSGNGTMWAAEKVLLTAEVDY